MSVCTFNLEIIILDSRQSNFIK